MNELEQKPQAVLKQLALDIIEGKVFHSNMIKDPSMLHAVFMPITFIKEGEIDLENLGMLYEYIDKQGPRSINGYPTFTSAQMLHKDDQDILQDLVDKAVAMKEAFLAEPEDTEEKVNKTEDTP